MWVVTDSKRPASEGNEVTNQGTTGIDCFIQVPSGNQTWQWKMDHLSVIFLFNTSIPRGFSIAMFDHQRVNKFEVRGNTKKRYLPWEPKDVIPPDFPKSAGLHMLRVKLL